MSIKESIVRRNENKILFVHLKGTPIDKGSKLLQEYGLFKNFKEYNEGILKIKLNKKFHFFGCLKIGNSQETMKSIEKCLKEVKDIMLVKKLKSLSVMQTDVENI